MTHRRFYQLIKRCIDALLDVAPRQGTCCGRFSDRPMMRFRGHLLRFWPALGRPVVAVSLTAFVVASGVGVAGGASGESGPGAAPADGQPTGAAAQRSRSGVVIRQARLKVRGCGQQVGAARRQVCGVGVPGDQGQAYADRPRACEGSWWQEANRGQGASDGPASRRAGRLSRGGVRVGREAVV